MLFQTGVFQTGGVFSHAAGSYSPLDIRITRNDGEQEITGFSSLLPPGVTANLNGVPSCTEAQIAQARTKSGAQEQAEPSCPVASEIGHTLVGVGVGSVLAYTPGKLYMAGPYEGAPFSVVAITSAKVGPFDLGTVIVHLPLNIDPVTAQVSIPAGAADQIPHIVKGQSGRVPGGVGRRSCPCGHADPARPDRRPRVLRQQWWRSVPEPDHGAAGVRRDDRPDG